jgi:hypothetical protein
MFIIWGTSNKAKQVESGQFFCPGCRRPTAYELFRVVRRFELFFIPLFETKVVGEHVACSGCGGTFDAKVLDYTPQQIKASLAKKVTDWRCSECGETNPRGARACKSCEAERPAESLDLVDFMPTQTATSDAAAVPAVKPPTLKPRTRPQAATSSLAVVSMIMGLLSPATACVFFTSLLTAPAAIVMGHLARGQIRRSNGALIGGGMANIGLIAGYLTLPLTVLWMLFVFRDSDSQQELATVPGAAQFELAEKKIDSDRDGVGLGNTREARSLAESYSASMDALHKATFKRKGADLELKGDYVTWCELQEGRCAFLVHVPEYRKFTADAKKSLAELAWQAAQSAVQDTLDPGDELAVGLKGDILWGDIMVGSTVADEEIEDTSPDRTTSSEEALYAFFTAGEPQEADTAREPTVAGKVERPAKRSNADPRIANAPPINPIDPVTGVPLVPMIPPPLFPVAPPIPFDPTQGGIPLQPGMNPFGELPPEFVPAVRPPVFPSAETPPPAIREGDPGTQPADLGPGTIEPTTDPTADVDEQATSGAGKIPTATGPTSLEDALSMLDSEDLNARKRSLAYLRANPPKTPNQEVADKLLAHLDNEPVLPAFLTARALREWATPDQLPELDKLLDHEDMLARQEIVEAIGRFKSKKAAEAIIDNLNDVGTRDVAATQLKKIGEDSEEAVLTKLRDQDLLVRVEACDILAEIGTSKSVRRLSAMTDDPNPLVRMSAANALKYIRERLKSRK